LLLEFHKALAGFLKYQLVLARSERIRLKYQETAIGCRLDVPGVRIPEIVFSTMLRDKESKTRLGRTS
jgi:hypothetical protein